MTGPTLMFVVLLSCQTLQAFPITGTHRTHREELVVRVERLFQVQERVYRRRGEKHGVREEEGSRRHHVEKRDDASPSHFTECPARYEGFCLNGGTCRYVAGMVENPAFCYCPLTHFGTRCQNSEPSEEDAFRDLRRLFGSWSQSGTFYRRKKWRRP